MFSVVETIENDYPTAVGVQTIWLKNGKLYWPPGKNPDRKNPSLPQADWVTYKYKLLKTGIETFDEMLELEKMYSKHRNSDEFREEQAKKKAKRDHPVQHILKKDVKRCGVVKTAALKSVATNKPLLRIIKPNQKKGKENISNSTITKDIGHVGVVGKKVSSNTVSVEKVVVAEESFPTVNIQHYTFDPIIPDEIAERGHNDSLQSEIHLNQFVDGLLIANNQNSNRNMSENSENYFIQNTRTITNLDKNIVEEEITWGNSNSDEYKRLLDVVLEIKENDRRERKEMEARILSRMDVLMSAIMDISNRMGNDKIEEITSSNAPTRSIRPEPTLDPFIIPSVQETDFSIRPSVLNPFDIPSEQGAGFSIRCDPTLDPFDIQPVQETDCSVRPTLDPFIISSVQETDFSIRPSVLNPFIPSAQETGFSIRPNTALNPFDIPSLQETGFSIRPNAALNPFDIQSIEKVYFPIGPNPSLDQFQIQPETHTAVDVDDPIISESESDSNEEFEIPVASNQVQGGSRSESESDADSIPEPLPKKPVTEPVHIKLKPLGEKYRDENNFLYSRNNVGSSSCIYLRCMNTVKYNCPARVILKADDATLTIGHSHDAEKKHVDKARFYEKLGENCKLDPFEKPLKLHLNTKLQMLSLRDDPVDEGNLPSSKQTRSFIDSRLKEYIPRLPKTIDEFKSFIAQEKYFNRFAVSAGQTELPFYRGVWESSIGEKSVVFISEAALKLTNTLNHITLFMDGTFRALPYHIKFGQLYVINLIYKGHCYPLAYILMQKRTFTAYDSIFSNLKSLMPSVEVVKLMTDYEAATRKALRLAYPNAKLSGCFFHYVQAIFKKADKLNLLDDERLKLAVQKVAVLALLPNEFVEIGFNHIDEQFQKKKSQRWTKFRNYWKAQWASANISVYSLGDRTNNFSESSNRTLNALLKKAHPSLWQLIETLKLIEMEKSQDLKKAEGGQMVATRKRAEVIQLDSKIKMATNLFNKTQDVGAFLENVTYDENLLSYIKDHIDIKAADDETDDTVIPNAFDSESNFRKQHPREAARPK